MEEIDPHWYSGSFFPDYATHVTPTIPAEQTEREIDFVVEKLGLKEGEGILDLACGRGRHALELARRGLDVTGLDLDETSLRFARETAAEEGIEIDLVRADMREVPFEGRFDAVVNLHSAFGYFPDEAEDRKAIASLSRSMKPDGRFLMDLANALRVFRHFQDRRFAEHENGDILLHSNRYRPETGRMEGLWTIIRESGERIPLAFSMRMYQQHELRRLFEAEGLRAGEAFGGFAGEEFGLDSPRLILLARKA